MEMEYLKKVINDELKTMNESDRETFRKTALITYKEMLDEFKDRIEYFESRIINSMSNDERNKNIYTLITEKENYYLYEDNFYPLYAEDLKEIELSGTIDKKQTIKRIFIKKSYQDLLDLQGLVLDGNIIANGNYYEVKYKIEIDDKYLKQIKLLYDIFMINGQEWRTVNTANAMKIFKVTLDKYDVELENEKLDSKNTIINIEYDHLEEYIIENPLLLWNIQEKEIIGTMLVRPTENNIRYEHILKCNDAKGIYIYPKGQKIFLSYPTDQNNFHVITDKKEINIWKIWDIKAINNDQLAILEKDVRKNDLMVANNTERDRFVNVIRQKSNTRIRGEGEIERIFNSFKFISEYCEYKDYIITEECKENISLSYNMNDFINDEFKMKGKQNYLNFYIKIKKYDIYTIDVVSFVLSEIQHYFPEYIVTYITI